MIEDAKARRLLERTSKIESSCKEAGLSFTDPWDHWNYTSTSFPDKGVKIPFKSLSTIPKSEHKVTRVFGHKLGIKDDVLYEDLNKTISEMTFNTPLLPPYKGISFQKQHTKPKFPFHYRS